MAALCNKASTARRGQRGREADKLGSQWMALAGRRWQRARRTHTAQPVGQGGDGCAENWSSYLVPASRSTLSD